MKSLFRFLLLIGSGLLLAACGQTQETASAVPFVGPIPGSQAFVGLVREGNQVIAYVCDAQTVAEWFRGELQNDTLNLTSPGGARLQATFEGESATGSFTPTGSAALPFTAETATPPAGLFRSDGTVDEGEYVSGLIILPDGQHRGLAALNQQLFIVDPDPLDIQNGNSNIQANVNWGDGVVALPFNQVKINE